MNRVAIKRAVARMMPATLRPRWRRSYSQEGEDLVLVSLFGDDYRGVYVDIGAHDPLAWSNTKKLAERGWHGLNIDPMPGLADRFRRYRPRDTFLEAAIDIGSGEPLQYWMFDCEPRWNCLSSTAPFVERDGQVIRPSSHRPVPVLPIAEALRRADISTVDLVNLDIEGGEEHILRAWPWDRCPPKAICVEVIGQPAAEIAGNALTRFLASKGMVFTSQLVCSVIYVDRDFLPRIYPEDPMQGHFRRACLDGAARNEAPEPAASGALSRG